MIGTLITKLLTGEAGIYLARLRMMAVFYALMAVFALLAVVSLLAVLGVYLASIYGPLQTAIMFSAGWIVLIVFAWIGLVIVRRPPRKRAEDRLRRDIASIAGVAAVSNLPAMLGQVRRRKSLLFIPIVGAVGFGIYRGLTAWRS